MNSTLHRSIHIYKDTLKYRGYFCLLNLIMCSFTLHLSNTERGDLHDKTELKTTEPSAGSII